MYVHGNLGWKYNAQYLQIASIYQGLNYVFSILVFDVLCLLPAELWYSDELLTPILNIIGIIYMQNVSLNSMNTQWFVNRNLKPTVKI